MEYIGIYSVRLQRCRGAREHTHMNLSNKKKNSHLLLFLCCYIHMCIQLSLLIIYYSNYYDVNQKLKSLLTMIMNEKLYAPLSYIKKYY